MSRMISTFPGRGFSGLLLSGLIILLSCGLALASEVDRQTLELKLGGSNLINTTHPFKRVSIADPKIADVVVLSPKDLYVYGKKVGYTSVMLWEEGRGRTLLDVVVSLDLTGLKERIHQLFPGQTIEVYGSETGVVLSGTVSGPEVVDQVLRLTQTFLPKEAEDENSKKEGTGQSGPTITNLMKVAGIQQVMLEVKFAEVSRLSSRDWQAALGLTGQGGDLNAVAGVGDLGVGSSGTISPALSSGSLLVNFAQFAENPANIFVNINKFTSALKFLETEGLARTLAEPRLVTQSGQEARFLAGGEFPIPVPDDDGITIEFKEFGVSLVFTPVVMSDGTITLRVAPSVSEISGENQIPISLTGISFPIPRLSTRKLDTTVQLKDGQTLALAGLLQDNLRESIKKVPGLGNIPILGALFTSKEYQQNKTDLLIAVTPHLVKANKEGTLQFPGESLQIPNRFEFYLENRLEGRRTSSAKPGFENHQFLQGASSASTQGGLEGDFGHRPVTVQ